MHAKPIENGDARRSTEAPKHRIPHPHDQVVNPGPSACRIGDDPNTSSYIAHLALHAAGLGQEAFVIMNNKAERSSPVSVFRLSRAIVDRA